MSNELMLDVGQAAEIKEAMRRARGSDGSKWTNSAIKKLCEGRTFGQVLDIVEGRAKAEYLSGNGTVLDFAGTVTIPANSHSLAVRDNLTEFNGDLTALKVYLVAKEYKFSSQKWLVNRVEDEPIGKMFLCYYDIKRGGSAATDIAIIEKLGGEKIAVTNLRSIFRLLHSQSNGEDGDLLTDYRYENVFYVNDEQSPNLFKVSVCWYSGEADFKGGWRIGVGEVGDAGAWSVGDRVFALDPRRN